MDPISCVLHAEGPAAPAPRAGFRSGTFVFGRWVQSWVPGVGRWVPWALGAPGRRAPARRQQNLASGLPEAMRPRADAAVAARGASILGVGSRWALGACVGRWVASGPPPVHPILSCPPPPLYSLSPPRLSLAPPGPAAPAPGRPRGRPRARPPRPQAGDRQRTPLPPKWSRANNKPGIVGENAAERRRIFFLALGERNRALGARAWALGRGTRSWALGLRRTWALGVGRRALGGDSEVRHAKGAGAWGSSTHKGWDGGWSVWKGVGGTLWWEATVSHQPFPPVELGLTGIGDGSAGEGGQTGPAEAGALS